MSQVKNLRAMFETRRDSSPPEGGRTQQGLPASPAESHPQLSRVRASFVAVEKDGRPGRQRDTSSDSIPTLSRTISAGTESDIAVPAALVQDRNESPLKADEPRLSSDVQTSKRIAAPVSAETAPVTPPIPKVQPPAQIRVSAPSPVSSASKTPSATPSSRTGESKVVQKDKSPLMSPKQPLNKPLGGSESLPVSGLAKKTAKLPANEIAASSKPKSQAVAAANNPRDITNGAAKASSITAKSTSSSSTQKHTENTSSAVGGKDTHKPANFTKTVPKAISTAKANAKPPIHSSGLAVQHPRTPITPKSPAGLIKPHVSQRPTAAPHHEVHTAPDKSTAAKTTANAQPKTATAKPSGSPASARVKPVTHSTFPSNGIGFVKPRPRSPTRPVQLPSGLTTHTASSATKINVPRQSLSRQSGNYLAVHPPTALTRSTSRASVSTVGTAAIGSDGKSVRRQSPTVNRSRPSIGPPPKQAARDHSVTKWEKEVDEGFLARMMRPTQASALKTTDKAHVSSPPRKHLTTATTKRNGAIHDSTSVPAKKAVARPLSLPPYPPACITRKPTRSPTCSTTVVEEGQADLVGIDNVANVEMTASETVAPEPELGTFAGEPVDEVVEKAVEETANGTTAEAAAEAAGEVAGEVAGEPSNEAVDETTREITEEPATSVAEETVGEVLNETGDGTAIEIADDTPNDTIDETVDETAGEVFNGGVEAITDKSVVGPDEEPAEQPSETLNKPTETTEEPVETIRGPVEAPRDNLKEGAAEDAETVADEVTTEEGDQDLSTTVEIPVEE
ncbi:hypothetical protein SEPCBS119000_003077 [Sporothrix epigloea]|uniref:Mucin-7 n=1 Tax=Sporothrix epigloea TaxID=1892477 RepID=A0ABP0DJP6_9PEZI